MKSRVINGGGSSKSKRTSVNVGMDVYKRGAIAARLLNESVRDFAEKALDERSQPVLKKHGVKLPTDALAAA